MEVQLEVLHHTQLFKFNVKLNSCSIEPGQSIKYFISRDTKLNKQIK